MQEPEMKILGNNIKRYRHLKGLEQGELAKRIDISKDYLSRVERGLQPNFGTQYLIRICRELDVELCQFFMEDPESLSIKFIVSDQNLRSLEKVLDKITERADVKFKQGPEGEKNG